MRTFLNFKKSWSHIRRRTNINSDHRGQLRASSSEFPGIQSEKFKHVQVQNSQHQRLSLPWIDEDRPGHAGSKSQRWSCMLSEFSHVRPFVIPWTVAPQIPLFMGFSRQEYWSRFPCPSPGGLPDPGIKPMSLLSPTMGGQFFTTSATWKAPQRHTSQQILISYPMIRQQVNQLSKTRHHGDFWVQANSILWITIATQGLCVFAVGGRLRVSRKHFTPALSSLARTSYVTGQDYKGPRNVMFGQVTTSATHIGCADLFIKWNSQRMLSHGTLYKAEP